jgi:hypothetical protein
MAASKRNTEQPTPKSKSQPAILNTQAPQESEPLFGSYIPGDEVDKLSVYVEQLETLVEMVLPENADIERSHTQTALHLIMEKAKQIDAIVLAGYNRFDAPPKVVPNK